MGVFTGVAKAKKPISEGAQYLRENLKSIMDEVYKVTGGKDGYENADEYLEGMEEMPSAVRQLLTALRKDDYLGFDNPEQALRAIAEDVEYAFEAFDMSPQLKGAITKASNAAQFQASKAKPKKDFGRLGKAALPPVLGSIAATQTQEAEAAPISPVMMAAAKELSGEGSKIRQVGQKLADDYNAKNNTKLSATEYLDKKMPEAAVEMRDYTNAAVQMRGADDDAAANEILQAVRKKYGLAAPAALMTTSPEAAILGEPVPESNLDALKTGIARGYDQTMSNEGWLLGLASALGAEGANELRAKLAEQRNPAMGDQENELVRTIGEIIGSMSPGAL